MTDADAQLTDWLETTARLRAFVRRRVSSAADAEDIVQGVLLRLQESMGRLRNRDQVGPWLFRAARNAVVDHYRARGRSIPAGDTEFSELAHEEQDAAAAIQEAVGASLALLMARLPIVYREALILTELEGLTQAQAAEMIGISVSGMKSRVQRGRAQLRKMLEACCSIQLDQRQRVVGWQPRDPAVCACETGTVRPL